MNLFFFDRENWMETFKKTTIFIIVLINSFISISCAFAQDYEWIFYSDDSADIIGKAQLDGTQKSIVLSGVDAKDITVDTNQQKVYWSEGGTEIKSANLDGSNIESVITVNCSSITVSSSRGVLLWINSDTPKKVEGLRLSDSLRFDFLTLPEGALPIQVMAGRYDFNITVMDNVNGMYFLDINETNDGGTLTDHISGITSPEGLHRSASTNFVYSSLYTGQIFVRNFSGTQQTVYTDIIGPTEINYIYQSNAGKLFFIDEFGPNISSLDLTANFYGYNLTPVITGISNPTGFSLAKALDFCPADSSKTEPGVCGCGVADTDSDGDGTADCIDSCSSDPGKILPGVCGCGTEDVDVGPSDGTIDCIDQCPDDFNKAEPGICGCLIADVDSDGDGVYSCENDACDNDPNKTDPGICGCNVSDSINSYGILDCESTGRAKKLIRSLYKKVAALNIPGTDPLGIDKLKRKQINAALSKATNFIFDKSSFIPSSDYIIKKTKSLVRAMLKADPARFIEKQNTAEKKLSVFINITLN